MTLGGEATDLGISEQKVIRGTEGTRQSAAISTFCLESRERNAAA
jgi:hypothetical protein